MAFDGSAYDGLSGLPGPRQLRPATHDVALASYPLFILRLLQDALSISSPVAVEGPRVLRASSARDRKGRAEIWMMLYSDFEKCKKVAGLISVPLFPTDTEADILARISARVAVEFP